MYKDWYDNKYVYWMTDMTILTKNFNIILTNKVHNSWLFWNFDSMKDFVTTYYTFRDQNDYYPKTNTLVLNEPHQWILCGIGARISWKLSRIKNF